MHDRSHRIYAPHTSFDEGKLFRGNEVDLVKKYSIRESNLLRSLLASSICRRDATRLDQARLDSIGVVSGFVRSDWIMCHAV